MREKSSNLIILMCSDFGINFSHGDLVICHTQNCVGFSLLTLHCPLISKMINNLYSARSQDFSNWTFFLAFKTLISSRDISISVTFASHTHRDLPSTWSLCLWFLYGWNLHSIGLGSEISWYLPQGDLVEVSFWALCYSLQSIAVCTVQTISF